MGVIYDVYPVLTDCLVLDYTVVDRDSQVIVAAFSSEQDAIYFANHKTLQADRQAKKNLLKGAI